MPQLDLVSFLSQYFWLLVAFIGLYIYLYKNFLPKMYRIYSVRERLSHKSHDSKSSFQPLYTQASKKKNNLFADVMGYVQQTIQTAEVDVQSWKSTHSKQLLENSLSKFTNTFKKAVTLQSLSQFLVLKYAAPLTLSPAFSSGVLPKAEVAKKVLKATNLQKLGGKKKIKSTLLKSSNVYIPFAGLQSLATDILNAKATRTIVTSQVKAIEVDEKLSSQPKSKGTAKVKTKKKKA
uniref:ATP synthase YMF19-like N-terminal domain-containing protein n=1 Tax=Prototheca wickerhamii TaxID=3111 RepID=Q35692_PROWI|nr:hypothetical protein [Prototheca wickerhamii]AAD12644.1 unknown [Prototheca wickerhamii]